MANPMRTFNSFTPLMVLGTSSGAGKSLMNAALCRVLKRYGEMPLPFKGQNMSNNAWVDDNGGEMGYSQALQAWAAGIEPTCTMNPILLKPKGNCTSEVIHLGKTVGIANANTYYDQWFKSGWKAIQKGLNELTKNNSHGRLILEGAGSPVEVNLQSRDLTNLRLAKYLRANCLLVADIERGGVFAQIVGTLALLSPVEKKLIKGLLINRFRGQRELFKNGQKWLEKETGIPVIGIMPWLNDIFPQEDSLDLLERKSFKNNPDIEIVIIKLPSISNFSDLDPLEAESTVQIRWVEPGNHIGQPDAVILPGSKQTVKDLSKLHESGLSAQIKKYAERGGHVFGLCGGMQMLGKSLSDPQKLEGKHTNDQCEYIKGLDLLPITTVFEAKKIVKQRHKIISLWPENSEISGFEIHHGVSNPCVNNRNSIQELTQDPYIGWVSSKNSLQNIGGTYLHGIFDNGHWRRLWLNKLRETKDLERLPTNEPDHLTRRESIINNLADAFEENINIKSLLNYEK